MVGIQCAEQEQRWPHPSPNLFSRSPELPGPVWEEWAHTGTPWSPVPCISTHLACQSVLPRSSLPRLLWEGLRHLESMFSALLSPSESHPSSCPLLGVLHRPLWTLSVNTSLCLQEWTASGKIHTSFSPRSLCPVHAYFS